MRRRVRKFAKAALSAASSLEEKAAARAMLRCNTLEEAQALAASGFLFSDGHRNAFDLSIGPEGELFSVDNGPDWDMSDEINWVRPGLHYGFPWRMGSNDNPQQFSNYDPSNDPLLQNNSWARQNNLFYNDPICSGWYYYNWIYRNWNR